MGKFGSFGNSVGDTDGVASARRALLEEIAAETAATSRYTGVSEIDPRVMEAIATVPRHAFVPPDERPYAWLNRPLPIGCSQTISQSFIVALMSSLLEPRAGDRILEIGTGCGYQAAILSGLVSDVYSVELEPVLARNAAERLKRLGYDNVHVRAGDGRKGWAEHGPYDGIIVTAGAPTIPPALIDQLKPGGRMIIPVDVAGGEVLQVVSRNADGTTVAKSVLPVQFVPLRKG